MEADFGASLESAFRPYSLGQVSLPVAGRVFLVATRKDVSPLVHFGNAMLQRMRVLMAEPEAGPDADEFEAIAALSQPAPTRPVKGEILGDEQGRLYEKLGNFVRPLRQLAASQEGDLVEVGPEPHGPPACRTLFPEPGQWRVLCWGEFKSLLAPQIAHPERLRDNHRLPCYVQVIETTVPRHVESIAAALLGSSELAKELLMLSDSLAERLDLTALLPPRRSVRATRREPGLILPSDRLLRLQVAIDPTAEKPAPESEKPANKEGPEKPTAARLKKTAIPDSFLKGEFRVSREEAVLDMQTKPSLSSRFEKWRNSLGENAAFHKWQRLLWGKELEEQLWSVHPPKGMLTDARIHEWACCTLESAGYDTRVMLPEWEIYWRRRGF
jgi:hypothetical protein